MNNAGFEPTNGHARRGRENSPRVSDSTPTKSVTPASSHKVNPYHVLYNFQVHMQPHSLHMLPNVQPREKTGPNISHQHSLESRKPYCPGVSLARSERKNYH